MMKKILSLVIFWLLFSVVSAQYNRNLFDQENVYVYDLKNLESDLKKNYTDYQCAWTQQQGLARNCTTYKLKTAPDKYIRQYVTALKKWNYVLAASINNKYLWRLYSYPHQLSNAIISHYWAVPYHRWLIWFDTLDQVGWIKFYYITVVNNKFYKFRSNVTFTVWDAPWTKPFDQNALPITQLAALYEMVQTWIAQPIRTNMTTTISKEPEDWEWMTTGRHHYERLLVYLQWKDRSPDLDVWTNAFKSKIKKLFR